MRTITVIGVGAGCAAGLTLEAREAIRQADRVFAAERHSGLVQHRAPEKMDRLAEAVLQAGALAKQDLSVAILVSGDPGLYSLLPLLKKEVPDEFIRVVPGVSALQAFCARLCVPWQSARVLSAHGRRLSESGLLHLAKTERELILFCDRTHSPKWMAETLARAGLSSLPMQAGENLGYEDEKITKGTAGDMASCDFSPLCMARIENPNPAPVVKNPPDEAFIRDKTPMTKRGVRGMILDRLNLPQDAVVWDVGAGTGSVSVACALSAPMGTVYAVERNPEACALIERNKAAFHLDNIEVVPGEAPDALAALPAPTHVFLGGTGNQMDGMISLLEALPGPLVLCAAFVTLDNAAHCLNRLDSWEDLRAEQASIALVPKIGRYRMLQAQNPVFVISAHKGETA